jgi:hypothetical protein
MKKIFSNPIFAILIRSIGILYIVANIINVYIYGDIILSDYTYSSFINLLSGFVMVYKTEVMKPRHRKLFYAFVFALFAVYAIVLYYSGYYEPVLVLHLQYL